MKLINIEEHYMSSKIASKISTLLQDPSINVVSGANANGVCDLFNTRLSYMDKQGIDTQIISYASGIPATLPKEYAVDLCKEVNDEMYEACAKSNGRFYAFAHLPLSDPIAAANELERCVKELGFVGAMISAHYQDLPYDDEHYFPIFAKAQELDVPIYLHPGIVNNEISKHYYQGNWDQQTTFLLSSCGIGWHYDVGMQVVRMISANLFEKLPNLKIVLGHWGELVSFYMYRLDEVLDPNGNIPKYSDIFKKNIYVNPSGMLREEQLNYCLATFGEDHIMWGEDYPYRQKDNIKSFLLNSPIDDSIKNKIAYQNAEKLFKLK